jgi:hypothetical protein
MTIMQITESFELLVCVVALSTESRALPPESSLHGFELLRAPLVKEYHDCILVSVPNASIAQVFMDLLHPRMPGQSVSKMF